MIRESRRGLVRPWGRVALVIEALEPRRLLALDLAYSSFLGGADSEIQYFVLNLPSGDSIVVGTTASSNFTTTPGLDTSFGGGTYDAFVARLHQSGTVMWSTFLGGNGDERPKHIALDTSGNLILSGSTKSTDFPATAGLDQSYGGGWDGFVTRLDPETGSVVWSTYLGGLGDEFVTAMPSILGDWYIAGNTGSADFPVINGFDDTYGGGDQTTDITSGDVFVGRIDLSGEILSASFVGGNGYDMISSSFALDPQGNLYVPMQTQSTDLLAEGGFSSPGNGYVIKIAPSGARVWSARIGGSVGELLTHLSVDDAGNVQIAGLTGSADWPATAGMDTTFGGQADAYLTVLDSSDGSQRWGTYIGGNGNEFAHQFFPQDGYMYGLIEVGSTDLPASGGYDLSNASGGDRMVVKYTMDGELEWSTYIGGEGKAGFGLIRVNGDGSIYFVGTTSDPAFSAVGGFDTTYGSQGDGVVVRIGEDGQRQWSTFVGGAGPEIFAFSDSWIETGYGFFSSQSRREANDIIVYALTGSDDFVTKDGFDPTFNGPSSQFGGAGDVLIVHLASDGTHNASSYLGGSSFDSLDIWRTDENGDILMVGTSSSADFPTTPDASDASYGGGSGTGDVVITRLSFGSRETQGLPKIDSFTDTPDPVAVDGTVTLSATASDADGSIASVSFYVETNGVPGLQIGGDLLLVADADSPYSVGVDTGFLNQMPGHSYMYYAVATDDLGGASTAAATINTIVGVNQPPTINSFTDSPDPVAINSTTTLSATAGDADGFVAGVSFYVETNGIAGLQTGSDLLLFEDTTSPYSFAVNPAALNQTVGSTYTYYAFATDNQGATSAVVSTTNTPQTPGPTLYFSSFQIGVPGVFFSFHEPIDQTSVTADDLLITNLDTGATTNNAVSVQTTSQTVFFYLPTDLPDGAYRFRIPAGVIRGSNGAPTLANADSSGIDVFFLAGDANHDRKVNIADYLRIDRGIARGKSGFVDGDFNYDHVIDAADYFIIDQAYLAQFGVPLAAVAAAATGEAGVAGAVFAMAGPGERSMEEEEETAVWKTQAAGVLS